MFELAYFEDEGFAERDGGGGGTGKELKGAVHHPAARIDAAITISAAVELSAPMSCEKEPD